MEDDQRIHKFEDDQPGPDPVFEYDDSSAGVPIVIDNG